MKYKVIFLITLLSWPVAFVVYVRASKAMVRTDILEQCQNHQSVTIDGIEIHCGVISSKSIKEWNNEQL
jgi:hypothetical protein